MTRDVHRYTYVLSLEVLRFVCLHCAGLQCEAIRFGCFPRDYETLHIVVAYCCVFVRVVKVSRKSFRAVLAARGGAKSRFSRPISVSQRGRENCLISSGTVAAFVHEADFRPTLLGKQIRSSYL